MWRKIFNVSLVKKKESAEMMQDWVQDKGSKYYVPKSNLVLSNFF